MKPAELKLTGSLEMKREKIVQLDCGFYHSALITDMGKYFIGF